MRRSSLTLSAAPKEGVYRADPERSSGGCHCGAGVDVLTVRQHLLPRLKIGNEAGVELNGAVPIGAQSAGVVGGDCSSDVDCVNSSVNPPTYNSC